MIDVPRVKQLVRQVLLASNDVQAIAGSRVMGAHPQDADSTSIPMPCVIFDVQGGAGSYCQGLQTLACDVYAYSRTSQDEADALYGRVYACLHATRLVDTTGTNTQAGGAREVARPDHRGRLGGQYADGSRRPDTQRHRQARAGAVPLLQGHQLHAAPRDAHRALPGPGGGAGSALREVRCRTAPADGLRCLNVHPGSRFPSQCGTPWTQPWRIGMRCWLHG